MLCQRRFCYLADSRQLKPTAYRNQNITISVFKQMKTIIFELLAVMNSDYGLILE